MSAAAVVDVRDLTRRHGEQEALSGVTFQLGQGQRLAVLGSNGAGKTTLLKVLATLLRPHSGTIELFGIQPDKAPLQTVGKVGYLGHAPLLYSNLTARENLHYHARLHRSDPGRIKQLLEQLGLKPFADRQIHTLSRGAVQRVDICRCLLHEPQLLLLDEPYSSLDPASAEQLSKLLAGSGTTTVLVTHDTERALRESDLVLGLRRGRKIWFEPSSGVDSQAIKELYL